MFLIFLIIFINFIIISDISKARNTTSFVIIIINSEQFLLIFKRIVIETSTLIIFNTFSAETPSLYLCIILITTKFMVLCILHCFEITSIHIITDCFFTLFFIFLIITLFIKQTIILQSHLSIFWLLSHNEILICLLPQIYIDLTILISMYFFV